MTGPRITVTAANQHPDMAELKKSDHIFIRDELGADPRMPGIIAWLPDVESDGPFYGISRNEELPYRLSARPRTRRERWADRWYSARCRLAWWLLRVRAE